MVIKAGVIGHPISHSKSPLIHGAWLKQYAIDGEYKAYDIPSDDFENHIKRLVQDGLKGFNVTLPYKQKILSLCADLSDGARAIGAVNTVTIDDNGLLHGHNTDAFGFTANLEETFENFDWTKYPATVIGAGGAARAILYALQSKNVPEIRITNRTYSAADNLASLYNAKPFEWDNRNKAIQGAGLVINTTSLGMIGGDALDIDLNGAINDAIIYDIVYTPLITPLLEQARQKRLRTVTGIGMLLHQARPAFNLWYGIMPEISGGLKSEVLGVRGIE
jgi:shikimate dehydrogenase